jgi:hypothetical protein
VSGSIDTPDSMLGMIVAVLLSSDVQGLNKDDSA